MKTKKLNATKMHSCRNWKEKAANQSKLINLWLEKLTLLIRGNKESVEQSAGAKKRMKQNREWQLSGTTKDMGSLDYSVQPKEGAQSEEILNGAENNKIYDENVNYWYSAFKSNI